MHYRFPSNGRSYRSERITTDLASALQPELSYKNNARFLTNQIRERNRAVL